MGRKKNDIIQATADIVAGGVGLGTGSLAVGGLAAVAPGNVPLQRIAGTAQAGLGVTAVFSPVRGAGAVLNELRKAIKK